MNKLWSFGDSFTFGEGIERNQTFTNIIAKKIGFDNFNFGHPGFSNKMIYQFLESSMYNISKKDKVLVVMTTPHRDDVFDTLPDKIRLGGSSTNLDKEYDFSNKFEIPRFITILNKIENLLKGYDFKITMSFNPIFGYDYFGFEDKKSENFIEWGKPNNTLIDIVADNWCKENQNNIFMNKSFFNKHVRQMKHLIKRGHPTKDGHKEIANKLIEYYD